MVNYVKTKNGYFYKICKNGKKRISEDEYNKQKKLKKMTGGVDLDYIIIDQPNYHKMENIFLTGDISSNGRTSRITRISKDFMTNFNIEKNKNYSNDNIKIVYVGNITYTGSGHYAGIRGTSNIWIYLNISTNNNRYRYIVEIQKNDDYQFQYHVKCALESLCNLKNSHLIIKALPKIGVQLDERKITELAELSEKKRNIPEINEQIGKLKKEIISLENQLNSIIIFNRDICHDFEWTFTLHP